MSSYGEWKATERGQAPLEDNSGCFGKGCLIIGGMYLAVSMAAIGVISLGGYAYKKFVGETQRTQLTIQTSQPTSRQSDANDIGKLIEYDANGR